MPKPLNRSVLGAHTIILSKNIHKITKTYDVWFEFLWIRRYQNQFTFAFDVGDGTIEKRRKKGINGIFFGSFILGKQLQVLFVPISSVRPTKK